MDTQSAYDLWAGTYDTVANKTRDLELIAAKELLDKADFSSVLEIGCGTGKNTEWILERAGSVTAVDFSEGMLGKARAKIKSDTIQFCQADITKQWNFSQSTLIISSLVLEHIADIDFIFEQAGITLQNGGCFYICELHPYKQLEGSRAKFEMGNELIQIDYFIHHIADFFSASVKNKFKCINLKEWFDDAEEKTKPRLVSFLFQKQL